jgi:hypothetical protein
MRSKKVKVRVGADLSVRPFMPGAGRLQIVRIRSRCGCVIAVGNDKAKCGDGDNMSEAAKAAEYAGALAVISIAFEALVPIVAGEVYEAANGLDRSRQLK